MRLGIFGGTFNPIHLAHLIIAERLREEMSLGRVIFIPSALPPHKEVAAATASHRLAMVRLAVLGNPFFTASDLEVARGGRSYAVDTLREIGRGSPGDEFFFIIGTDAFAEISSWKEPEALFSLASFIVIPRPGHIIDDPLGNLPPGVKVGEIPLGKSGKTRRFAVEGGKEIFLAPAPQIDISASEIRRRIREGLSIRYLVPAEVEAYIRREQPYREREVE